MTRIALISDIHANEVAQRVVLAEVRRTGVDEIICLGDVATLGKGRVSPTLFFAALALEKL